MNKTRRKAPAFQEYASDWLADERFRDMTAAERGILWSMRLECWVNARVPKDTERLARRLGYLPDELAVFLTDRVLAFFADMPDQPDYLHCPELTSYRMQLAEKHQERSQAGRRGADSRWGKDDDGLANGSANDLANGSLSRDKLSREGQSSPKALPDPEIPF